VRGIGFTTKVRGIGFTNEPKMRELKMNVLLLYHQDDV